MGSQGRECRETWQTQANSGWIGPSEREALRGEVVVSFTESSDPHAALAIGQDFLQRRDQVEDLPLLLDLSHQLGLLCLRIADYASAIRYFQQADRYFKRTYQRPFGNAVLEGRLLTDTGIAFRGQQRFAQAIAYWRMGEERLKNAGADEQAVPRRYIEEIRQMCREQGSSFQFDALWQASETHYHWLSLHSIARLMTPDEEQRFFGTPTERGTASFEKRE
jgi:tetratricopeptide (TPR) repeat protein